MIRAALNKAYKLVTGPTPEELASNYTSLFEQAKPTGFTDSALVQEIIKTEKKMRAKMGRISFNRFDIIDQQGNRLEDIPFGSLSDNDPNHPALSNYSVMQNALKEYPIDEIPKTKDEVPKTKHSKLKELSYKAYSIGFFR